MRIYKPEQTGLGTQNIVHLTDRITYGQCVEPGKYFVVIRDESHKNPRTLVLTKAELEVLAPPLELV